jgi:hypothetical protein
MNGRKPISITQPLTVKELAAKLSMSETVIIKQLFLNMQVMRTVTGTA